MTGAHSLLTFASCGGVDRSSSAYWALSLPHTVAGSALGGGKSWPRTWLTSKLTRPFTVGVGPFEPPPEHAAARSRNESNASDETRVRIDPAICFPPTDCGCSLFGTSAFRRNGCASSELQHRRRSEQRDDDGEREDGAADQRVADVPGRFACQERDAAAEDDVHAVAPADGRHEHTKSRTERHDDGHAGSSVSVPRPAPVVNQQPHDDGEDQDGGQHVLAQHSPCRREHGVSLRRTSANLGRTGATPTTTTTRTGSIARRCCSSRFAGCDSTTAIGRPASPGTIPDTPPPRPAGRPTPRGPWSGPFEIV